MAQKCKTGQIWDKKVKKCVSTTAQRRVGRIKQGKGGEVETVIEFQTPKGKRYYSGKGKNKKLSWAMKEASDQADRKFMTTPSDSLESYNVDRYLKGKKLKKKKKRWWK